MTELNFNKKLKAAFLGVALAVGTTGCSRDMVIGAVGGFVANEMLRGAQDQDRGHGQRGWNGQQNRDWSRGQYPQYPQQRMCRDQWGRQFPC